MAGSITLTEEFGTIAVGDILPDRWTVGPVSPTTGRIMVIEPFWSALQGNQTWYDVEQHTQILRAQGGKYATVRQPDADESDAIYEQIVVAGLNQHAQLNTSDFNPYGGLWTCTPSLSPGKVMVRFLDNGKLYSYDKDKAYAHGRCVRDEPNLTLA